MRSTLVLLLGLLLIPLWADAQHLGSDQPVVLEPHFEKLSIEEGLSNNTVHSLHIDRKGFLWIGTGTGLNRYDGRSVVHAGGAGLTSFILEHPTAERITAMSNMHLGHWVDSSAFKQQRSDRTHDHHSSRSYKAPTKRILSAAYAADGTFRLGTYRKGLQQLDEHLEVVDSIGDTLFTSESHYLIQTIGDQVICGIYSSRTPTDSMYLRFLTAEGDSFYRVARAPTVTGNHLRTMRTRDGHLLFSLSGVIYRYDPTTRQLDNVHLGMEILSFCEDRYGQLWVGTYFEGLFCYPDLFGDPTPSLEMFKSGSITAIVEDREGGLWTSGLGQGLSYFPNPAIRKLGSELDGPSVSIIQLSFSPDGTIHRSLTNGKVDVYKTGRPPLTIDLRASMGPKILPFGCYYDTASNTHFIGTTQGLVSYHEGTFKSLGFTRGFVNKFVMDRDRTLWGLSTIGLSSYDGDSVRVVSEIRGMGKGITLLDDGRVHVVTDGEVIIVDGEDVEHIRRYGLHETCIASDYVPTSDTTFLACCMHGLLHVYPKKRTLIHQDALDDDLLLWEVRDVGDDHEYWCVASTGLLRYRLRGDSADVLVLGNNVGLKNTIHYQAAYQSDTLWVSDGAGIAAVDVAALNRLLDQPDTIPFYLRRIEINQQAQTGYGPFEMDEAGSQFKLSFEAAYFQTGRVHLVRYRLLGLNDQWIETTENEIQYAFLPEGEYQLELEMKNKFGRWQNVAEPLTFTVHGPFWLTWWFILTEVLVASLFLALIARAYYRRRNHKIALDLRLVELESKALRAQMNPHFIFNALNSVQSMISANDKVRAGSYLSSFAKLVRFNLDLSRNSWVDLEDELAALKLYLKFEAVRFKEKLTAEVVVAPEVEVTHLEVPPMLLQPFVENAIIHGVGGTPSGGSVTVHLRSAKDGLLVVQISNRTAELPGATAAHDHQSHGLSITRERLEALLPRHPKAELIIFKPYEGEGYGTDVIVIIPYQESY